MTGIQNLTKLQQDSEYKYTIKENCECPQLRKVNNYFGNAIVLAPKKNLNGETIRLNENTFVLNDSIDVRHEIYSIAQKCGNKSDNDLVDF